MITLAKVEKKIDLEKNIRTLRKELILIGTKEGLTSENTIKISQKLDLFITKYQMFHKR